MPRTAADNPFVPLRAFTVLLFLLLITSGCGAPVPRTARQTEGDCPVTILPDGSFYDRLRKAIQEAESEVAVCTFLFVSRGKPSNRADRIVAALLEAAERGVDVRVVLEQDGRDKELTEMNRKTGRILSERGVLVYYDDPDVRNHAKLAVIDGRMSFVGSHNITDSALRYNRELSLLIESPDVAGDILSYIDGIAVEDEQ